MKGIDQGLAPQGRTDDRIRESTWVFWRTERGITRHQRTGLKQDIEAGH